MSSTLLRMASKIWLNPALVAQCVRAAACLERVRFPCSRTCVTHSTVFWRAQREEFIGRERFYRFLQKFLRLPERFFS